MPPMSNGLLYLLTIGIWGSTWLAIEFQLGVVPPEVSVFYRYVLASALLFGWCVATRRSLAFPAWAHLRFMLLGVLMFSLNYLLTYRAQVHVTSALAAIAFSTMLWMNMINARLFFGVRSDRRAIAGSLLGIAGIVVIFEPQVGDLAWTDATFRGCLLALAGALFASFGNIVSQAAQQRSLPIMATNAWAMGYGALFTGGLALLSGSAFANHLVRNSGITAPNKADYSASSPPCQAMNFQSSSSRTSTSVNRPLRVVTSSSSSRAAV